MDMRTVRLSCLVAVIAAAMGFSNSAFATDDYRNCTSIGGNAFDCSATNYGDVIYVGNQQVFNLMQLSKDQTARLKNIGNVAYRVVIEQGLRTGQIVVLQPGWTTKIAPFDNGFFSWGIYSILIISVDANKALTPAAKARIRITAFTPKQIQCQDQCTTEANSCREGCSFLHSGTACLVGCDTRANICLTGCESR